MGIYSDYSKLRIIKIIKNKINKNRYVHDYFRNYLKENERINTSLIVEINE